MNEIKTAVFVGCMLGIAFFVLKNILPNQNIYKSFKNVMSLVMLVSMISILTKIQFDFSFDDLTMQTMESSEDLSKSIQQAYVTEIEETAEKNLKIYFDKNGLTYKDIVIETFFDEYNYLEIKNITISVKESDKIEAEKIIKDLLGEQINLEFVKYEE